MEFFTAVDWGPLVGTGITFLLDLAGVLVLLLLAWIVSNWARRKLLSSLSKRSFDPTLTKFFGNLVAWGILLMSFLAALGIFGIQTTSFAAVIGAAGLAIGLAFQGTLGNFASGIMLLIFRPFKVGDVVKIGGETGKVNEVELFVTSLDTPDNRRIIMPNGKIFGNVIENITFHPTRRVDVAVGTDYGASLDECRRVLNEAIQKTDNILQEPAPQIYLNELGSSSINWAVRVWTETPNFWAVKEQLTYHVKTSLDDAGIGIPFPQMDVHMDGHLLRGGDGAPAG